MQRGRLRKSTPLSGTDQFYYFFHAMYFGHIFPLPTSPRSFLPPYLANFISLLFLSAPPLFFQNNQTKNESQNKQKTKYQNKNETKPHKRIIQIKKLSVCVDLRVEPSVSVAKTPSDTPPEKAELFLPSRCQLQIAFCLEVGLCVHPPFSRPELSLVSGWECETR